jgi:glycine cleavage system H lipoate-binding protein
MTALVTLLQALGAFLLGLLARAGLVLGVMLAMAVPVLLVALVLRGARALRDRRLGLREVAGLGFRPSLRYAPTHTWLAPRRGAGLGPGASRDLIVGLDDLALRLLPRVTGVEVPRAGTRVAAGDPIATVFAGSRVLTVPAPVAGLVLGGNRAVQRDPSLVQREGYGRGWLVALAPDLQGGASAALAALAALPTGEAAAAFLRAESARWNRFLEEALGFSAADGGKLVAPAPALLDERSWRRLAAAFLGA